MSTKWIIEVTTEGVVEQGTGPDPAELNLDEENDQ